MSATYEAATVEGTIKVDLYRLPEDKDPSQHFGHARRRVSCEFSESFVNDWELEGALDAFRATVLEAARR